MENDIISPHQPGHLLLKFLTRGCREIGIDSIDSAPLGLDLPAHLFHAILDPRQTSCEVILRVLLQAGAKVGGFVQAAGKLRRPGTDLGHDRKIKRRDQHQCPQSSHTRDA